MPILVCISLGTLGCGGGSVDHALPLAVSTTSLPSGVVGAAYSSSLLASGGTPPFAWSVTGTLPYGLSLSKSGTIVGKPAFAGTAAALFFRVTDSTGEMASTTLSITIDAQPAPLSIITKSLPAGTVGEPYSWAIQAAGGTTPYSWKLTSGALPTGLSISSSTGAITGIPKVAGTYDNLTFQVTDANETTADSDALSIIVSN